MDLDLIIRDHSGKVLAVDVTVVGRARDVASRVADKLYGHRSTATVTAQEPGTPPQRRTRTVLRLQHQ